MKRTSTGKTLTELYGTGHYNPRSFDRRPQRNQRRLYAWGIFLFLLAVALATALGLYLFARTPDSFTGERVKLALDGPTTVRIGGDENYTLQIINDEEVDLTDAGIFVGYNQAAESNGPQAAVVRAGDADVIDNKNTWDLGTIAQGETKKFNLVLRFSGRPGSELTLPLSLRFRPKGFSSELTSNLDQRFVLSQSAVGFTLSGPATASPGSEVTFTVAIAKAAADWVVRFNSPEAIKLKDNVNTWRVGDLPLAGDSYQLTVRGTVAGNLGDKLTVTAELQGPESNAGVIREEKVIAIQSSAGKITLAAAPGSGKKLQWDETLRFKVIVANTGEAALQSSVVSVSLAGEDWWQGDSLSIQSGGFFEGGNVIWDETTVPALGSLEPGQSQTLEFSLKTRSAPPANLTGMPAIAARAKLRAKLGDEEIIVASEEASTKILTNIEFDASAARNKGQETTYTITWQLAKSSSELKDLRAAAALGKNVKWLNGPDYSVGELVFNEESRTVEWRSSKIPKITEPITIRFTVGLTAADQVTNNTVILQSSTFSATDALANESLGLYANAVRVGDVR